MPAEGDAAGAGREVLRAGEALHALGGGDRAGGKDVGSQAAGAVFDSGGGGEGVDGGFGGRDVGLQGWGRVVEGGGDEEDAAAGWGFFWAECLVKDTRREEGWGRLRG